MKPIQPHNIPAPPRVPDHTATGPTEYFLPLHEIEEWDKPGEPVHDPEGLAAFISASKSAANGRVQMTALDCHINDSAFCEAVLTKLDTWVAEGIVPKGVIG